MPPAARMMDMVLQTAPHCHAPIHPPAPTPTPVPHPALPLPILTPCAPMVLVGKMPAARVTDTTKICTLVPCVPAGPGIIAKGSATVLIQKLPAARLGDTTSHPTCVAPIPSPTGNIIPPCCPTVIIGDGGGGGGGGGGGASVSALGGTATLNPDGSMTFSVGNSIEITGTPEFCAATMEALAQLNTTPSGAQLIADIQSSPHTVTIVSTREGNEVTNFGPNGTVNADGSNGSGQGSTVHYNPDRTSYGSQPWQTRPPAIGLGHELIHARHAQEGSIDLDQTQNDARPDPTDPTKTATTYKEEARTVGLDPYNSEPYTENSLRDEWQPQQPERPYY